jgi:hypothetical protein
MPVAPGAPDTVSVQLPAAAVGQIIAFLSGTAVEPAAGEEAGKAVREAGNDPNQLANLIMKAVEARQQDHPLAAGETLGNIVADCLRRAVDGMKQAPGGQTQKAQRETMRTLTLVEKQIVDHIRKLNEEGKTPDDETVTVQSAVKEMKLQVEAESIAGQFAKQQSAAMDAEKAFAKFVAKNGPDVLEAAGIRTMLLEAGLAPEVWSRLVAASQQRAGKGARIKGTRNPGASDKSTDNQLTRLLADLVTDLEAGGTGQVRDDSFEKAMSRVDGEVVRLIAKTDSKIDALAEAVRKIALEEPKPAADSHEDASIDDGLSRRKLLNLMLEIVHEIRQPLAVIHSSIAMLQTPGVGVLSPVQQQLVALMGKSETRIGSLTERLERIM